VKKVLKSAVDGQRTSFSVVRRASVLSSTARRPQLPLLLFKRKQEAYAVLLHTIQRERASSTLCSSRPTTLWH